MHNLPYLLALHKVTGLGFSRITHLLQHFGDPKLIWEASSQTLRDLKIPQNVINEIFKTRQKTDPDKYFQELTAKDIRVTTFFDDDYPKPLKEIGTPPLILYYFGKLPQFDNQRFIGVVGTRKMTSYGKVVTENFTKQLVDAGFVIVSGLARGVDTCAHRVTLIENGITVAVLGGGLENIYPAENQNLVEDIIKTGGAVISEFPPNYQSLPGNFPARNRIIAGLSEAVLVTEADEDSGSLITAHFAAEFGKEVFAVPGPVTSQLSKGPVTLIKQGAKVVFSASDIFEELGIQPKKQSIKNINDLPEDQMQILKVLEFEEVHIDEIARKLNQSITILSALLVRMEISGLIKNIGNGVYVRI